MWDTTAAGNGLLQSRDPKPMLTPSAASTDPAAPVRSPVRILLGRRTPQSITGTLSRRVDGCTVTSRATLSGCRGHTAELSFEEEPTVNPLTCEAMHGDRSIRVPIRRE